MNSNSARTPEQSELEKSFESSVAFSKGTDRLTNQAFLLSLKCLALCNFSYVANDKKDNVAGDKDEEQCRKAVGLEDGYSLWLENGKFHRIDGEQQTSLVITGVLQSPIDDVQKIPFVCFRGTQSLKDMKRDLTSIFVKPLEGKPRLVVGGGFLDFYETFRQQERSEEKVKLMIKPAPKGEVDSELERLQRVRLSQGLLRHVAQLVEEHKTGLIVTGHSLGGAISSLFMADFANEYKDLVVNYCGNLSDNAEQKRLGFYCVTFGSPRVFDQNSSRFVEHYRSGMASPKLLYEHLRFVNAGDVITAMPRNWWNVLCHVGHPIYAKELSGRWEAMRSTVNFGIDSLRDYYYQGADFVVSAAKDHLLSSSHGYNRQFTRSDAYTKAIASIQDQQMKASFLNLPLQVEDPKAKELRFFGLPFSNKM